MSLRHPVDIVGFYLIHHFFLPLVASVDIVGLAKSCGLGKDARICGCTHNIYHCTHKIYRIH